MDEDYVDKGWDRGEAMDEDVSNITTQSTVFKFQNFLSLKVAKKSWKIQQKF